MEKPVNVDRYIANSIADSQPILVELRKMIKATFLNIEEKIGYGVPQYKYGDNRMGMSVAKKHVTIGFDYGAISNEKRKELESEAYLIFSEVNKF